jgi:RNA polymerase sigma-70 factor (ECF subfamily)
MIAQDKITLDLLDRAAEGNSGARTELLARHRGRLRQMVAVHIDKRLAARFDPSDVVQDALLEAARELPEYLRQRPVPFYPWLRQLAWERLVDLHRRHIQAQKRSVQREEPQAFRLPDESALELADRLVARGGSPVAQVLRQEQRDGVRLALKRLGERDQQILVLRHLEQLSIAEIAAVLNIREGAVKTRLLRALLRFRNLLVEDGKEVET